MCAARTTGSASNAPQPSGFRRIPPNFFAIPFGLAGLTDAWRAAIALLGIPVQIPDALAALTAAVWVALLVGYFAQGWRQIRADSADAVLSPFVSLTVITPLILTRALLAVSLTATRVLVVVLLVLTVVIGGLITAQWIVGSMNEDAAHPGYFLPTVAGGFVGAYAAAAVHLHAVAEAFFGIGILCWILLSSTLLTRLFFRPMLPPQLVPTLAILLAPPVVAGFAYAEMTGGRIDFIARALGGYAILMALVQVRFVPLYAKLKFSPGFWSFTFSYAAAIVDAMLWLTETRPPGAKVYAGVALALITILIGAIAGRTLAAIRRREFFPEPPRAGLADATSIRTLRVVTGSFRSVGYAVSEYRTKRQWSPVRNHRRCEYNPRAELTIGGWKMQRPQHSSLATTRHPLRRKNRGSRGPRS